MRAGLHTPAPMIAKSPASSRASKRVASPLTAAVRIAVMAEALTTASNSRVVPVEKHYASLMSILSDRRVAGENANCFQAEQALKTRAKGWHQSQHAFDFRRPEDRAQWLMSFAASQRYECLLPSRKCIRTWEAVLLLQSR